MIFCDIVFFSEWIYACIRLRYITKFSDAPKEIVLFVKRNQKYFFKETIYFQFKRPPKVIERKIRVPKARPGPRRNRFFFLKHGRTNCLRFKQIWTSKDWTIFRQKRGVTEPTIFGDHGRIWNKEDQVTQDFGWRWRVLIPDLGRRRRGNYNSCHDWE